MSRQRGMGRGPLPLLLQCQFVFDWALVEAALVSCFETSVRCCTSVAAKRRLPAVERLLGA